MDEYEVKMRERITALESSYNLLAKRVEHIEELVESVQKMTVELQHMREDINHIGEQVDDIEAQPAKNWQSVVSAVLGALAGGIGAALLSVLLGG